MSSSDREPTNEQLWAQPPVDAQPDASAAPSSALAPLPATPTVPEHAAAVHQRPDRTSFVLAIVSIALAIPLTAIATNSGGLIGLLVVWIGIVAVNAVYALSRRH